SGKPDIEPTPSMTLRHPAGSKSRSAAASRHCTIVWVGAGRGTDRKALAVLTVRPPIRSLHLVFESHDGRALVPIPKRSTSPWGDIDTVVVDGLKALDLERPIREAHVERTNRSRPRGIVFKSEDDAKGWIANESVAWLKKRGYAR